MGICWYCHWGWAKPVAEIYLKALEDLDGDDSPLTYGPGHIVFADENFDSAEYCLSKFDEYENFGEFSSKDLEIVRSALQAVAALPLDVRCIEPDDYDDEHPELYPPTVEVVRV